MILLICDQEKLGRCIKELERLYGIKVGKPNYEKNSQLKTQEHLASDMGIDVRTLQNYKMLSDRTPKVSDLNQEQLDNLSSTGFQYVTNCHVLK